MPPRIPSPFAPGSFPLPTLIKSPQPPVILLLITEGRYFTLSNHLMEESLFVVVYSISPGRFAGGVERGFFEVVLMSETDFRIRPYTFAEFVERVKSFHGYEAIGVIIGGFMVDLAYGRLPEGCLFDAVCETPKCLPDAVQLLTPCTLGNGWVKVINVGRFALTLYDKRTGVGIRVFVDPAKIGAWPELEAWFFKLKSKKEQDTENLLCEAQRARADMCGVQAVTVADWVRAHGHRGRFAVCPACKESYPVEDGDKCLACQGKGIFDAEARPLDPYFVLLKNL